MYCFFIDSLYRIPCLRRMSGESRTKHPSLQGLMYEMYKKNLAIIQARNSSSDKTIFNFFYFFLASGIESFHVLVLSRGSCPVSNAIVSVPKDGRCCRGAGVRRRDMVGREGGADPSPPWCLSPGEPPACQFCSVGIAATPSSQDRRDRASLACLLPPSASCSGHRKTRCGRE